MSFRRESCIILHIFTDPAINYCFLFIHATNFNLIELTHKLNAKVI